MTISDSVIRERNPVRRREPSPSLVTRHDSRADEVEDEPSCSLSSTNYKAQYSRTGFLCAKAKIEIAQFRLSHDARRRHVARGAWRAWTAMVHGHGAVYLMCHVRHGRIYHHEFTCYAQLARPHASRRAQPLSHATATRLAAHTYSTRTRTHTVLPPARSARLAPHARTWRR